VDVSLIAAGYRTNLIAIFLCHPFHAKPIVTYTAFMMCSFNFLLYYRIQVDAMAFSSGSFRDNCIRKIGICGQYDMKSE
jgi:di/tricarboxylate transporter